jgi:hypothetical protein
MGQKHIIINHIAISIDNHTFKNKNIWHLNHRLLLKKVLWITGLALDLQRNKQAY